MRRLPFKKSKIKNRKLKIKIQNFGFCIVILIFAVCILNSYCFAFEPPRYEIEAKIDINQHKIIAKQKVIFTNNSDKEIDAICFHVFPHRKYTKEEIRFIYRYAGYFKMNPFPEGFQSGDLKIKAVSSPEKIINYETEGQDSTILKINLFSPLKPGESQEINIDFTVEIPHSYGRFGWHEDIITLTRWYPILSVLDKNGWHNYPSYLYHHPYFSEASFYKVRLTLPQSQTVAASGILKNETLNSDGTKTQEIEAEFPVRDFSLGISSNFLIYSLKEGNLKINSYYLKGDQMRAKEAAGHARELIKFHSQRFGKYPYSEFNIVPSFLGYGGEQSSGQIFIDTRVYKLPGFLNRYFDFLISHETGHQWFYNLIGSDEYKEMFLDEGMNSYWILECLEHKYGPEAKVMVLPKYLQWLIPNFSFRDSSIARYIYLTKNGLDRPIIGELSGFKEPSSIFALTYGKGSAVIGMLEKKIGRQILERIMQRYTKEFRFKNISLGDFIRISNEESGQDLSGFFEMWLKTKKTADFAVKQVELDKIILENRGAIQVPIETKIVFADGKEIINRWDGQAKERIITVKNKVKKVQIDPENKIILDINQTNNLAQKCLS